MMSSKMIILLFIGASVSSDFFIDLEEFDSESPLDRAFCCLTANAQSKCSSACASQDCAASCTVRCGVLNSVCATYVCSAVASSTCTTTTTTTTTAASTCLAGGTLCNDFSTVLGDCCTGLTCTPIPPTGAF